MAVLGALGPQLGQGPVERSRGAGARLVGDPDQQPPAGTVVDEGLEVVVAAAAMPTGGRRPAQDPVAATVGDAAQLLVVLVEQLPGMADLIAADRQPAGPVEVGQARDTRPAQHGRQLLLTRRCALPAHRRAEAHHQIDAPLRQRRPAAAPRAATWGCGYQAPNERMQYTASSFASGLTGLFRCCLGTRGSVAEVAGLHPGAASLATETPDAVLDRAVLPACRRLARVATWLRARLQHGVGSLYLLYVALAVVVLLAAVTFLRG